MMYALTIERQKSKHAWVLLTVAGLLIGVNVANGIGNYLSNAEIFRQQDVTWLAIWGQAGLTWATLFFPFLISMRAASLTRMEHEQGNWRRMASYGANINVSYRGKLTLLAGFVCLCQIGFTIVVLGSSLILGFQLTSVDVAMMLGLGLLGAVGGMTIAAVQLSVGILVRSFATTVAIGLVASILSLVLTLIVPALEVVYPYAQAAVGMGVRALAWPTGLELATFLVINLALISVAIGIGRLALRRKEY